MCLLALLYRVVDDAPVVVGANREEAYARPGEPPLLQGNGTRFVAGRDPREGGTWLGVNEHGLLVAVTNRPKSQMPLNPRSRGLLVRDLLTCPGSAVASGMALQELGTERYQGCNILCADKDRAVVIQAGDWLRAKPLPPGIHVLSTSDINNGSDPRIQHSLEWLYSRGYRDAGECLQALELLCKQTGNGTPAICLKGENHGTISSSLIALRSRLTDSSLWHAQGSPAESRYEDYSDLLHALGSGEERLA